jgi:predicted nucleotide-binding protein
MSLEEEFNKRIAVIHGLGDSDVARSNTGGSTMDIRHAEFQVMADVFLGEEYDRTKLEQIEKLQITLHDQQAALYRRYSNKELSPEEYVSSFNNFLDETFTKCEEILGYQDFSKLFGAPRHELGGFIDREAFVHSHESMARNLHRELTTFIVHGHDDTDKYALKNLLQNSLKLGEPIILHEQPSLGRSILEKIEDMVDEIDAVFVLLTPDNIVSVPSIPTPTRRARQNVIFELGYFLAKLERRKGRVLLLYKGQLELPSDISGLAYIDISNGVESVGEIIRRELSLVL